MFLQIVFMAGSIPAYFVNLVLYGKPAGDFFHDRVFMAIGQDLGSDNSHAAIIIIGAFQRTKQDLLIMIGKLQQQYPKMIFDLLPAFDDDKIMHGNRSILMDRQAAKPGTKRAHH